MDIILAAAFVASKTGKTGLTPTVTCYATERSTDTRTTVVNAQTMTEVGLGLYEYRLAGATPETHDYKWCAATTDSSVDAQQVHGWLGAFAGAYAALLANLDAAVSSRLATSSYTSPANSDIAAIKVKTDSLPSNPAAVGSAMGLSSEALGDIADAVGEGVTVNATVAISTTQAASVVSGRLAIRTHYTFDQTIASTSEANLAALSKLWLTIKTNVYDADTRALLLLEKTAGVTVVAGATYATPTHGALTVSGSAGDWEITIHLAAAIPLLLSAYRGSWYAELKGLQADGDTLLVWEGLADIELGIVKAVN